MITVNEESHGMCRIPGCPLAGTVSGSTGGSSDWYCFIHYGRNAGQLRAIGERLDPFKWLAGVTIEIRAGMGSKEWPEVYRRLKQEILRRQRPDLLNAKGESAYRWVVRLENHLHDQCTQDIRREPPKEKPGKKDTWTRVDVADLAPA